MQKKTQESQRAGVGGPEDHSQDSVAIVFGNTMVKQEDWALRFGCGEA